MSHDSTRSGNSNSNSKRSFNSFSSNNTNDDRKKSSSKKKKSESNQKTLGAAWGSNSLSSSRSSFRSSPFSDFGSYMAVKNKKLHNQFDAEASSSSHNGSDATKPIFQGVSIFVDGFTTPSNQELRGYMLKHGGRLENYFSRRRVTHIICSNLPDSKIKNLRSFSRGLPVVKPTWILDCVAAGKLLSWIPYQLDQLCGQARSQPKLSAFFSSKGNSVSQDVSSASTGLMKVEAEIPVKSELHDVILKDNTTLNVDELSECTRQGETPMKDENGGLNDNTTSNVEEVPDCTRQGETEMGDAGWNQVDSADSLEPISGDDESSPRENGMPVRSSNDCSVSPIRPVTSHNDLQEKASRESSGSMVGGPSHRRHSTTEDPNFVENYFKSSRLHFIGTWRNRYRKRFTSQPNKIKKGNPDVTPDSASMQASIIHMDMDCFFVAVVIRNRQDLVDKPVAVCHSDSPRGTAEISSANYPARDYGVKAGMFVRDAKARCPHLLIVPYNFKAYEEVADQFYNILHHHCDKVQAVSCDEAFLDVTNSEVKDPELLASMIRKEVLETTGCTVSAGIGGNLLMARLATSAAKPDGQCKIPPEQVDAYLSQLPIKSLPGIGRVLEEKLKRKGVQTCGQLRMYSKDSLQKDFGTKTGQMLWNYCRGVDNRLVGEIQENKSVGAEVNWGVRFKDTKDCEHFLLNLCKEVCLRLVACGVQGRTFTLKIKKRRKDAEEPAKYMGCGDCENFSHSTTVPVATDDVDVLQRITMQLLGSFNIDVKDIRGVGLQVTKLESADIMKQGHEQSTLRSWLASGTACSSEQTNSHGTDKVHIELGEPSSMVSTSSAHETSLNVVETLPSVDDLDLDVIENLPPELFSELDGMYGGKLKDLIFKRTTKVGHQVASAILVKEVGGKSFDAQKQASDAVNINIQEEDKAECSKKMEIEGMPASGAGTANFSNSVVESANVDFMPSSLSQVDGSVLQQLPEDLRADILGALPSHRRSDCLPESSISMKRVEVGQAGDRTESAELAKTQNFWEGNPPRWVQEFKTSNCLMLNVLAGMYLRSGSRLLSSTLQCCLSGLQLFDDLTEDFIDEASSSLCELFRQYIQLKLEVDIEELYVSFRLLKRLTMKFKGFLHVYDAVLPHLQACVSESYGGNMHLPAVQ